MKDYRCPYCGEEAFSLRLKLGVNTKFGRAPRCPKCKKVAFRHFLVGGRFLYFFPLGLAALLSCGGILISGKTDVGIFLSLLCFTAFYLAYQYYFCHFDTFNHNGSTQEMIHIQMTDTKRIWPRIRKGEIYELLPERARKSFDEDVCAIGMVEHIRQGKITLRVIKKPAKDEFAITDKVILMAGDIPYSAHVISSLPE